MLGLFFANVGFYPFKTVAVQTQTMIAQLGGTQRQAINSISSPTEV